MFEGAKRMKDFDQYQNMLLISRLKSPYVIEVRVFQATNSSFKIAFVVVQHYLLIEFEFSHDT